jgi:hypothetical protein
MSGICTVLKIVRTCERSFAALRMIDGRGGATWVGTSPDEFCRPNAVIVCLRSVGTRGGVERMRGPCACPGGRAIRWGSLGHDGRPPTRTSTRPPPIPASAPCPYRTRANVARDSPIRLSKFIRTRATLVTAFVRQTSLGTRGGTPCRVVCKEEAMQRGALKRILQAEIVP